MSAFKSLPPLPMRRLARFFAVIAIAMAAGHLVQTMADRKVAVQVQASAVEPVPAGLPTAIVQLSAGSADEPAMVPTALAVADDYLHAGNTMDKIRASAIPDCGPSIALQERPNGMVALLLTAPCRGEERVVLRHAGLAVTGRISANGNLETELPALNVAATVEVLFQDGSKLSQSTMIPAAATLRRFGVQWMGAEAFAVHGFENGADFGQVGDISASNPGFEGTGTLHVLGDASVENPLMAQIYTYPADPIRQSQVVIEAAVTIDTCGHDLLGEAIMTDAGRTTITDLTLAMPDCSGVGDFLVLKNLASDMKIAAN